VFAKTNGMLAAFGSDLELVRPKLNAVCLEAGQVLSEPGERVRNVFFLQGGMVSKLAVFEDGTEIECALVGREGAVGAMAAMGLPTAITRDVCHMRVDAWTMGAAELGRAAAASPRIRDALDRYCAWKMSYAIRNGACNARHPVGPRLCRWLLTCADVLEASEIPLPQDVFAKMLGVQRTSVNPILQRLRAKGLIELQRSRLKIRDRSGLRAIACECYAAMPALEYAASKPAIRSAPRPSFDEARPAP
jgi:CRP-like cAMP-binding protein